MSDSEPGQWCRSVAATGLRTTLEAPNEPLADANWNRLLVDARRHGLLGLLGHAVTGGSIPVTPVQAEEAWEQHLAAAGRVLLLRRQLLRILEQFADSAVDVRVLKGPAVAELDYPDPSMRLYNDIDLLVSARDWSSAAALLVRMGGRRRFPEPRAGFDREFSKGACFRFDDGDEVDLHRTLALGWFGLALPVDELFTSPDRVVIGATPTEALSSVHRLLHACIHASLGGGWYRLLSLRDVAQCLLATTDAAAVLTTAHRWRCEVVVADAIATTWTRLGLVESHDLHDWATAYRPQRPEAQRLASYHGEGRTHARLALEGLSAIDGWSARIRYLRAVATPRRDVRRLPTTVRVHHGLRAARRSPGS